MLKSFLCSVQSCTSRHFDFGHDNVELVCCVDCKRSNYFYCCTPSTKWNIARFVVIDGADNTSLRVMITWGCLFRSNNRLIFRFRIIVNLLSIKQPVVIQAWILKANNSPFLSKNVESQFSSVYVDQLEDEDSPVLEGTPVPPYIIYHLRFSLPPDLKHEINYLVRSLS